jgi:hypothetical protein
MTEHEWLVCDDPRPMLIFLQSKRSDRKLRLFGVACCRRFTAQLTDMRSRTAVEVSERFADNAATEQELETARQAAEVVAVAYATKTPEFGMVPRGADAANAACYVASFFSPIAASNARQAAEKAAWEAQRLVAWEECGIRWDTSHQAPGEESIGALQGEIIRQHQAVIQANTKRINQLSREAGHRERAMQLVTLRCIFGNPFRPVVVDGSWRTTDVVALAQAIYEERAFDRMPILADALEDAGCTFQQILNHCRQSGVHVRGCFAIDLILGKE